MSSEGHPEYKLIKQFRINGYTGTDIVASALYSRRMMARRVAKKLLRDGGPWCEDDPENPEVALVIRMPTGNWRVTSAQGHVEPYTGKVATVGP